MAIPDNAVWRMPFTREQIQKAQENVIPTLDSNGRWLRWDIQTMQWTDTGWDSVNTGLLSNIIHYSELAGGYASSAETSASAAGGYAASAKTYMDSAANSAAAAKGYAESASASASSAAGSASAASQSAAAAKTNAEAAAKEAADTAYNLLYQNVLEELQEIKAVYSVILIDLASGIKYAMTLNDGHLVLEAVSDEREASNVTMLDSVTKKAYSLKLENEKLFIEEL